MYARIGRPSIAPEKLLRAQLLQMLYSIRSERLLREEMDYNLLFRWFVGLNADDEVWDATTCTKNRDRLLEADVAQEFLARVVAQERAKGLTSDEHFTVDGTLLEACASLKSFQAQESRSRFNQDERLVEETCSRGMVTELLLFTRDRRLGQRVSTHWTVRVGKRRNCGRDAN